MPGYWSELDSFTTGHTIRFVQTWRSNTWRFHKAMDLLDYRSKFISVFNQLDAQNLFHNKFYFMPLHVSSTFVL